MTIKQTKYIAIIGVAKSGTSALHDYFSQHPDVIESPKDYPYFSSEINDIHNDSYYKKIINQTTKKTILISDVNIIYSKHGLIKLKNTFGEKIKIILILRHPRTRLISHFIFNFYKNIESRSLDIILKNEFKSYKNIKIKQNDNNFLENQLNYLLHSDYPDQLNRLFALFQKRNITVLFYENFFNNSLSHNVSNLFKKVGLKNTKINFIKVNETIYFKKHFLTNLFWNPLTAKRFKFFIKSILSFKQRVSIRKYIMKILPKGSKLKLNTTINSNDFIKFENRVINETEKILGQKIKFWRNKIDKKNKKSI